MPRPRGIALVLILAALAGAGAGVALAVTLSGNRHAARRDARQLLARLVVPAAAVRSSTEPRGDHGYLRASPALIGDSARADAHAWWTVPGSDPAAVIAYVEAHPPAGGTLSGTGSSGNSRTGTSAESVYYEWPAVPGVLGARELAVTVTALAGGGSGVLVETQSDWIVPRSRSERVPAGVHEIDVTVADVNGPTTKTLNVTDTTKVRRVTAFINRLPIVQPEVLACPVMLTTGAHQITLSFLGAGGQPPLAQATFTAFRDWDGDSGQCNPVDFTIGGRSQTPLIGGAYVKSLQRLLGTRLY